MPLLLVAILGGIELQRQSARVDDAVQQQAATFLHGARLHFEGRVRQLVESTLAQVQLGPTHLVAQTRAAIDANAHVLDLFCLDAKGQLVHPRLAAPREQAMPFLTPPASDELRLAEHLVQIGDPATLSRARQVLRRYLGRRQVQPNERARAAFRLGSVLRQLGELDAAEEAYLEARVAAVESEASPMSIELLTRIAVAELRPNRSALIELARDISENAWWAVPDPLSSAVFARALAAVPRDGDHPSPKDPAPPKSATPLADPLPVEAQDAETPRVDALLAELREQESARRTSRRLGAEFERFAAPALQRVLADGPTAPVLRSIGSGVECALLALRPTSAAEQGAAGRDMRWLGLRIDLPGLVNDAMDEFLSPRKSGYRLAVLDPEGTSILEGGPASSGPGPEVPTLAGMILRAVPVDPAASRRDEYAAIRNRVLILAALLALAFGGGFLLVRSVARDAELSTLKMEFVSRMSHELKTPLALIKMYGETLALRRAADPAQAAHFGEIVAREADRLTRQIERILAFAQQQSGTLRYVPQRVDLGAEIDAVVEEYREHVEASGCTLAANTGDMAHQDLIAQVDPHALHLALAGLIENAVKYTDKTQADRSIAVELARDGDHAVIAVRDRGIGIPAAERQRVFEAFYRASNAGEVRGAGLGLSQVRHFAQAHGGDVVALPHAGGGSILRLRLPLLPERDAGQAP